jgi:hypothetical protein
LFGTGNPSEIVTFLQRKDSTLLSGRTPQEAWRMYLVKNTGKDGNVAELERIWLIKQGGVGATHAEVLDSYLSSKGFNRKHRGDSIKDYANGIVTP